MYHLKAQVAQACLFCHLPCSKREVKKRNFQTSHALVQDFGFLLQTQEQTRSGMNSTLWKSDTVERSCNSLTILAEANTSKNDISKVKCVVAFHSSSYRNFMREHSTNVVSQPGGHTSLGGYVYSKLLKIQSNLLVVRFRPLRFKTILMAATFLLDVRGVKEALLPNPGIWWSGSMTDRLSPECCQSAVWDTESIVFGSRSDFSKLMTIPRSLQSRTSWTWWERPNY